jgi:CRISPR-associated protein Csx16
MIYLVTRHPGALAWMREQFQEPVQHVTHLDDSNTLHVGDCVAGILPAHQISALNARGVRYLHLCVDMPASLRGQELSAEQLNQLGAHLQEYRVLALSPLAHLLEH